MLCLVVDIFVLTSKTLKIRCKPPVFPVGDMFYFFFSLLLTLKQVFLNMHHTLFTCLRMNDWNGRHKSHSRWLEHLGLQRIRASSAAILVSSSHTVCRESVGFFLGLLNSHVGIGLSLAG